MGLPYGSISGGIVRLVSAKELLLYPALPAMSLIRLGVKFPVYGSATGAEVLRGGR
jgi:hypothetical protein